MRTLFLNPPSYAGFDGGAGSRYQARREIRSFWYPTWLAQAAALVPDSKLIDAPADDLSAEAVIETAKRFEFVVIFTSTPSFDGDARLAADIKRNNPSAMLCFVGPHVSALPEQSLVAAQALDFVVRKEFDLPIRDIAAGAALRDVRGVSWRDGQSIRHNPDSEPISNLDSLPFVVDVYKRDLTIENYFSGYLRHPYMSIYGGRGCPARCTFCLWPQTMTSHTYRTRSPESVYRELALAKDYFPQVKEFFLDDDTFTAAPERAAAVARKLKDLGITWSASGRANTSLDTLKTLKECGLRLLLVGFESGSDEILRRVKKGITTDMSRRFVRDCRSLGIALHGAFIIGLPGETRESIEASIRFACELDPDTVQVSVAAPYPGTEFYEEAVHNGWLDAGKLVTADGTQDCLLEYDGLTSRDILDSIDRFYKRFYARPKVMIRMGKQMLSDAEARRRRLREGKEFVGFLRRKKKEPRACQG